MKKIYEEYIFDNLGNDFVEVDKELYSGFLARFGLILDYEQVPEGFLCLNKDKGYEIIGARKALTLSTSAYKIKEEYVAPSVEYNKKMKAYFESIA